MRSAKRRHSIAVTPIEPHLLDTAAPMAVLYRSFGL